MIEPFLKKRMRINGHFIDLQCTNRSDNRKSIIFIHGIGVSGRYFIPLAQELSHTYNVFVLDLPGYGKTPKPDHPLTIPELAKIVQRFTHIMDLTKPILIGQSMGCQIAAKLAHSHQSLYSKVILIGPTVNKNERTAYQQCFRLLQDGLREPWQMNRIIMIDYLRMGVIRYLQTTSFMINDRIEYNLIECRLPVLIIRGKKDPISPHEWATFLKNICLNSTLKEVHDAPHNVHYTNSKSVARLCMDFLSLTKP